METLQTQVAIIGAGPAGMLLAELLSRDGVDSVVIERQSRAHVLGRIRAGVLEAGAVDTLRLAGLGERLDRDSFLHEGVTLVHPGGSFRVDFAGLAGKVVTVYGQTQVQRDLFDANDRRGGRLIEGVEDVELHGLDSERPQITFLSEGAKHRIDAQFVAGCDGFHGVSRTSIPKSVRREYEKVYPFGWLGVLSETPPVDHELIYVHHERGFALCSMRHAKLSRYYLQVPEGTEIDDWSDDRFWGELRQRIPSEAAERLVAGPSIEKSIAPLRSFVSEPMSFGRLFLAGDCAHIVPPTGAKGLNLAISDVTMLSRALSGYFSSGSTESLDSYSDRALRRVWKSVRFSWWMTALLHRFPDDDFAALLATAELSYLGSSVAARTALAENYVGLPL